MLTSSSLLTAVFALPPLPAMLLRHLGNTTWQQFLILVGGATLAFSLLLYLCTLPSTLRKIRRRKLLKKQGFQDIK
ncbi:hypothetical protein [Granulicella tundricola]|uniref:Uncharacterized protein n=1 Tax=Granulicella tundricola (strain ATCC BAA-1859 / DSM 23138 / MP5ACTX9) TaxID=1198114 RepID=E8X6V2_GRATM|nr:hypothetical protein [Granulicella tundricola]ADW71252.1 hypothetical protein AciX9_3978 [Granulicella tundricola MP5ACTX9]